MTILEFKNVFSLNLIAIFIALIASYSLNAIWTLTTPSLGGWVQTLIAGQPLSIAGNGTSGLDTVAFQAPKDLKYNATTNVVYVKNNSGHIREINLATGPPTVSSAFGGFGDYPFRFNKSGTNFVVGSSCARWMLANDIVTPSSSSLGSAAGMLSGPCNTSSGTQAPVSGTNATDGSALFPSGSITLGGMILHSNGHTYFGSGTAATSNAFIYESYGGVINRVAGITGTAAYNHLDSGNFALGSSMCNGYNIYMQEILSGTYAGDILVLDCDRLRRISITTESANPKIYDVVQLSLATGYTANTTFNDFIYDSSSESSGILGSGAIYYVSSNTVHKWQANSALSAGIHHIL